VSETLDLLLINPAGRADTYQDLGIDFTAIEPPLWCRLLAGHAIDRGHSCMILDCEALQLDPAAAADRVASLRPRLVAMVVFGHQPSASTQRMAPAGAACREIKARVPEQKIIILGGHVSALPERTMREEAADFACVGEGPATIDQLLGALGAGAVDFSKVDGLVWRDGAACRVNPRAPLITDLDRDLHGDVWHLLPMDRYRAHNWQCFGDLESRQPYASIYTTLGCPFQCSFCCINAPFATNRYRMRSPAKVVAEIEHLYTTYGVKTFKIIDEMFVLNDRHVRGICEQLGAKPFAADLNIWAYARVDTVKAGMLPMLRKAGIRWLALGIESGSAHVRDGAQKTLEQADIVSVVREIQRAGIYVMGNFIFGLPDDDRESMRETFDLAAVLNCEFANFYSAMAYPGSSLYDEASRQGWPLPTSWSGFSQHSYDCTPLPTATLAAADVLRFRDEAFTEYFSRPEYRDMVVEKFGIETLTHVEHMLRQKLPRRLLEEQPLRGAALV
jgi:anaerobic magnesium-protoporphyrin IX monomethyl ester cyclase